MTEDEKMSALRDWLAEVSSALELDPSLLEAATPAILDLVREVAHGPSRPGGPLTSFAIGLVVGQTHPQLSAETTKTAVAAAVSRLADPLASYRRPENAQTK